jgi:two-component system sensor histidine kinase CpxA
MSRPHPRRRSLFLKIFLWFCVTVTASSALVLFLAGITGTQPFGRRWMALTQDLYARSAVDFYSTGGAPALANYLATIRRNSGIEGHLMLVANPEGSSPGDLKTDVLGAAFPVHAERVYRDALRTGFSQVSLGLHWTAATPMHSALPGQPVAHYIFVIEVNPHSGFLDGTFFRSSAPRLFAAALLVALCCLLLARHITEPIRVLEGAAAKMAGGNLQVRTLPVLRGRTDELASLAATFDAMAERIEALIFTQRQMLADISHELRSPLTRIGVSLELIRRGEYDVVESMQSDLDRLNVMIGQILDLMRLELPEAAAAQVPVDLMPILEDVVATANREGRAACKTVMLRAGTEDCAILGEETPLRSCLENIVRNALQHSPEGGSIQVTLQTAGAERVAVQVEDDGPGVPEDALPHLFTPFFRVPGVGKTHPLGSGLGLSVSARVVARYGGTIAATNRAPHGLCVRVELPRTTPQLSNL